MHAEEWWQGKHSKSLFSVIKPYVAIRAEKPVCITQTESVAYGNLASEPWAFR